MINRDGYGKRYTNLAVQHKMPNETKNVLKEIASSKS